MIKTRNKPKKYTYRLALHTNDVNNMSTTDPPPVPVPVWVAIPVLFPKLHGW